MPSVFVNTLSEYNVHTYTGRPLSPSCFPKSVKSSFQIKRS